MTFSILARDPDTQMLGGAAATGSLCVGGWVLRGDARAGMSASQGMAPSTLWGDDLLSKMRAGAQPEEAIGRLTQADSGRDYRQLSGLGLAGRGAAFTGKKNTPQMGALVFENGVAAGNMLGSTAVLDAIVERFASSAAPFAERLLDALRAGQLAGGDARGLQSAALLVVSPDHAPLSLRIDHDAHPLKALNRLYARASTGDYYAWTKTVPTLNNPERFFD